MDDQVRVGKGIDSRRMKLHRAVLWLEEPRGRESYVGHVSMSIVL